MKKITLFMTMFIAATMSIFAQNANELRLLNTRPSSDGEIEGIATSWEFIFSESAKVADNAVKELEIKNEANEVIACVGLTGVGTYENSIFTGIVASDTIWNEWYDEKTGETIKYPSMVYPTGLDVPGIYTMTIPAGTFVSAQDNNIAIAETTLTFNVIAPKPNWSTDYDYTTTVKEFETITISFENVKEVKLNEGVTPMLYTVAGGAEYTGTAELVEEVDEKEGKTTYNIKVSFNEKFSEEDTYYIMIPAGMFTMNNEVSNEEKQITLEVIAPVEVTPLAIDSIAPKFGENGEFLEVWIEYNQQVYFGNQENSWINYVVNLTDADGNQYPMWPKDPYDPTTWALVIPGNTVVLIPVKINDEGYPYEYNEYGQVLASPITTPGQYTLNLADVTVRYGYDAVAQDYSEDGYCEGTEVITIGENTAVEGIEAEAENAEIYDLTGRRVEKITNAGIYIVNGVKKVIK